MPQLTFLIPSHQPPNMIYSVPSLMRKMRREGSRRIEWEERGAVGVYSRADVLPGDITDIMGNTNTSMV